MKLDVMVGKLCDPAKFYLFLSFVGVVFYLVNFIEKQPMYTMCGLGGQIFMMVIYTYILNWVCTMKHGTTVSWFLVFLPFLFVGFMVLMLVQTLARSPSREDKDEIGIEGYDGDSNTMYKPY